PPSVAEAHHPHAVRPADARRRAGTRPAQGHVRRHGLAQGDPDGHAFARGANPGRRRAADRARCRGVRVRAAMATGCTAAAAGGRVNHPAVDSYLEELLAPVTQAAEGERDAANEPDANSAPEA